jgi:hypothetical protein
LLLVLIGVMALCGWPVLSLLPAYSVRALDGAASLYAILLSTIGTGALLAALAVARFGSLERRHWYLGSGVLMAAAAEIGLAVAGAFPLALQPGTTGIGWVIPQQVLVAGRMCLVLGCCLLLGFGLVLVFSTAQAVTQLTAGDHNRGVVMGIWSMIISGAQPLGCVLAGVAADRWGFAPVLLVQGLGSFAVGAWVLPLLACAATSSKR